MMGRLLAALAILVVLVVGSTSYANPPLGKDPLGQIQQHIAVAESRTERASEIIAEIIEEGGDPREVLAACESAEDHLREALWLIHHYRE